MNGFYKFSVKFADGHENEAHGFVYASTYISAMEKVEDFVSDEDIISINLEGMEPGDTLLMPEWIADKVYNYDYYATDYKMDNESTYSVTEQGKEVLKNMSVEDKLHKELMDNYANGTLNPASKPKLSKDVENYVNTCLNKSIPIHLPSYPEKEND